jgi:PPM family protein phosphatase
VTELVRAANDRVYRRALEDPAAAGMGTTVTVALFDGDAGTVTIGHVGDSRAYRVRDERLEQLTADHSLVAELVRSGRLTPEQAADHPHRSVITRALGTEASVDVDVFTLEAAAGDLFLLCSDGLTTMVGDDEILALAAAAGNDPEPVSRGLVDAANRAGGEDNITVVVFEVVEGDEPPDPPPAAAEPTGETAAAPADAPVPAPAAAPVRRRGAGKGGRALALLGLLVLAAGAALLVWWSVGR